MTDKVLIVYASKRGNTRRIAQAIAEGVERTGLKPALVEATGELNADAFDLVFIGSGVYGGKFDEHVQRFLDENKWADKRVAVFACYSSSKAALDSVVTELSHRKARVLNSLNIRCASLWNLVGLGRKLSEEDLIRARGFGERTANNAFGYRIGKSKDKAHIKGYFKS
ncbi:MAG: flavodoxin domain-containing protein [Candidatus Micrarchaeia archaeon]